MGEAISFELSRLHGKIVNLFLFILFKFFYFKDILTQKNSPREKTTQDNFKHNIFKIRYKIKITFLKPLRN